MHKKWDIIEEKVYEEFRIFSARRSRRINPRTGKPFDFFLMSGVDWVNIIPLTPQNEVIMVRQYRHGVDQYTLEIPGGTVEMNEKDPQATAIRELEEETGYTSNEVTHLGTIAANPAMQSMHVHCYLARNTTLVKEQKLDPGEDIEVIKMPLAQVKHALIDGTLNHALVVAAFGLLLLKHPTA